MAKFSWLARSLAETEMFAKCLAEYLVSNIKTEQVFCICLDGTLGAGKTTLSSSLCRELGVPPDLISSPTFSLQNVYSVNLNGSPFTINHFDFYRIADEDELFETGFEETVGSPGIHLIEWANRFPEELPDDRLQINIFSQKDQSRELLLECSKSIVLDSLRSCLSKKR